jgi:hypothetical protein
VKSNVTGALSLLKTVTSFTMRRVAAAGEETTTTGVAPFRVPSSDPSVKAEPVSSDQCEVQSGFVDAAAPVISTVTDLFTVSRISRFISRNS